MENSKDKNLTRFLLTFFLGWIGSIIINHSDLKPQGYKSRTLAYLFLSSFTFGIYGLVASINNLSFDPSKESNIGYLKEEGYVYASQNNECENSSTLEESNISNQDNNKIQISFRTRLKKCFVLFAAIFSLIMIFIPFEASGLYSGLNIFCFITFQVKQSQYLEIPFLVYLFGYIHLIGAIILTILACRNFNNQKSKDKGIVFGSIACGVTHSIVDIIYSSANDYRIIFYYPKCLIIAICLCVIYFVIDKFTFTQTINQPAANFPVDTKNRPNLDGTAIELLKNLKELLDNGIITREEFEAKKKEILEPNN